MREEVVIDFIAIIGTLLEILFNAGIYYVVVRFLVFVIGLILKPIYKKRLYPDSKVEETKHKIFKNLYRLIMILYIISAINRCSYSI